jgi:hypothetical protein
MIAAEEARRGTKYEHLQKYLEVNEFRYLR